MTLRNLRNAALTLVLIATGLMPGADRLGLTGIGPAAAAVPACGRIGNSVAVARDLERAINAERRAAGLRPVTISQPLNGAATGHACDLAGHGIVNHRGSGNTRPSQRVRRAGVRSCLTAENVAMGLQSPRAVHSAWMNSRGHRTNILRPDIRRIGVGVARSGDRWNSLYWVLVMVKPC